jgi:cholesterol transport system auxiliary component
VVQDLLLRGFEDSGRIIGVGRGSAGLRGDFSLLVELRRFEADYTGDRAVSVAIAVRLARYASNQALATRVFEATVPIDGKGNDAVVAAFDAAMSTLVPELVDWTLVTGEANWQSQNPVLR